MRDRQIVQVWYSRRKNSLREGKVAIEFLLPLFCDVIVIRMPQEKISL